MNPFILWPLLIIVSLLVVIFLPFDWWQKAPSRQRDKLIGKLLGNYLEISPRNIILRAFFLCILMIQLILVVLSLPVIGLYLIPALLISYLWRKIFGKRSSDLPDLPGIFGVSLLLIIIFAFCVGLLAPLRLFPIGMYFLLGKPAGGLWEMFAVGRGSFNIDLTIGFLGIFFVALWLFVDGFWRLRQAQQVKNLPTSKVRSLAFGLVELKGIVKPAFGNIDLKEGGAIRITWDMFDYLNPTQGISRFRLDDGTGSVLVDARDCRIRAGWIADVYSIFGVREIVLTKRIERDDRNDSVTKTLEYGDTVYLIGNAEINPETKPNAKDTERLVVRPSEKTHWNAMLLKTLLGVIKPPTGKDIHNVFFLSDTDEFDARKNILKGFKTVIVIGCFWLFASAGLIWSTYMPEREAPPLDSWRSIYWRGIDNTGNGRYRRFEKYVQSLNTKSTEAIPALIEALQYKDYRYRERAAFGLTRFLPDAREEAKAAIPILIEMLENVNARYVQTPLIVLRGFGPMAKDAVPALIKLLKVNDDIVRFQAIRTLGHIGPQAKDAIPAMNQLLLDKSMGGAEGHLLPEDAYFGEGIPIRKEIHREIREALKRIVASSNATSDGGQSKPLP